MTSAVLRVKIRYETGSGEPRQADFYSSAGEMSQHGSLDEVLAHFRQALAGERAMHVDMLPDGGLRDRFRGFDAAEATIEVPGFPDVTPASIFNDALTQACEAEVERVRSMHLACDARLASFRDEVKSIVAGLRVIGFRESHEPAPINPAGWYQILSFPDVTTPDHGIRATLRITDRRSALWIAHNAGEVGYEVKQQRGNDKQILARGATMSQCMTLFSQWAEQSKKDAAAEMDRAVSGKQDEEPDAEPASEPQP